MIARTPTPSRFGPPLRRLESLLMAVGILCLAIVAGATAESRIYQLWGRWKLAADAPAVAPAPAVPAATSTPAVTSPVPAPRPAALSAGAPVGTIAIPEAGVDAVILHGVEPATLRRGVGHFPESPLPGGGGNFALAGHRDTFFRGLRHARVGQRIAISLPESRHCYRIEKTAVVEPTAVEVVADQGRELLTLVTCFPFQHVGPAPRRFVVQGSPLPGELCG